MQLSEGYTARLCSLQEELLDPLRRHLAPRLWDTLLRSVVSTACKRLETPLCKCQYTSLGGLTLDSDVRDLLNYTKDHLHLFIERCYSPGLSGPFAALADCQGTECG